MKHKLFALTTTTLLLLSLTGCGGGQTPSGDKPAYKNGTYQVRFAGADPDGYADMMTISIKNGEISILELDGVDSSGLPKSKDTALLEKMKADRKEKGLSEIGPADVYTQLTQNFKAAKGNVDEMEWVVGATRSSQSFVAMLTQLLEKNALTGEASVLELPYYQDGSYQVTQSTYDVNGYQEYLRISVSGGQVKIEEYDAKNIQTARRSADTETAFKVSPADLSTQLIAQFTEKGLDKMETVTGATRSSLAFKELLTQALNNAHFRGPGEDKLTPMKDGVYRAEMSTFTNGWKDYIVLGVQGGMVYVKEYGSVNAEGVQKQNDTDLVAKMKEASQKNNLEGIYPGSYEGKIAQSFYRSRYQVAEMENIAGATASTNHFKLMAGTLMGYSIPNGDTKIVIVEPLS